MKRYLDHDGVSLSYLGCILLILVKPNNCEAKIEFL